MGAPQPPRAHVESAQGSTVWTGKCTTTQTFVCSLPSTCVKHYGSRLPTRNPRGLAAAARAAHTPQALQRLLVLDEAPHCISRRMHPAARATYSTKCSGARTQHPRGGLTPVALVQHRMGPSQRAGIEGCTPMWVGGSCRAERAAPHGGLSLAGSPKQASECCTHGAHSHAARAAATSKAAGCSFS